jgi:CDP-diacylglycerol--serine O-phosphatidyltransferase
VAWGISFFFLICGALRLARFNVMARAPRFAQSGNTPTSDKRYFVGLPIPAAAGMLVSVIHFVPAPLWSQVGEQQHYYSWLLLAGMAILAILMVSTVRYLSFKNVSLRSNKPFITLPLLSLVVAGIWFYSQWVLLATVTCYVIHGPLLKLWGFINRLRRPLPKVDDSSAPPASIEN